MCSCNYQTYKIDSLKFQFLFMQFEIIQPILTNRFVYLRTRKYVIENQVYKTLHQTCRSLNFHNWVGTFISSSRKRNDIKASCNRLCSNCNTFLFFCSFSSLVLSKFRGPNTYFLQGAWLNRIVGHALGLLFTTYGFTNSLNPRTKIFLHHKGSILPSNHSE